MGTDANTTTASRDARASKHTEREEPREAMTRRLIEAIEQVRLDMARVELWADAVSGFSRPVPGYDPKKSTIWLPQDQAKELGDTDGRLAHQGSGEPSPDP